MPVERRVSQARPSSQVSPFGRILQDIKALNASVLLLSQKMKYLVRNEKILGRNLLVLNKKLKALQESGVSGGGKLPEGFTEEFNVLKEQQKTLSNDVEGLRSILEDLKTSFVKTGDFKELKFVIDSINPLEFVTVKQVEELIDRKLKGEA
ncbi:MAG: hypothetical protein ABH821_03785 [archaeon]